MYTIIKSSNYDMKSIPTSPSSLSSEADSLSCGSSHECSSTCMSYQTMFNQVKNEKYQPRPQKTLANECASKFLQLEGIAAERREIRRKQNRESARRSRNKRILLQQELEETIHSLEEQEQKHSEMIEKLLLYKKQLEGQEQQHIGDIQNSMNKLKPAKWEPYEDEDESNYKRISIDYSDISVKEEPLSPLPPWELAFSIDND